MYSVTKMIDTDTRYFHCYCGSIFTLCVTPVLW